MATSNAALAKAGLDALLSNGVRFAVLHNEEAIASGSFQGDVDLVVDRDPRAILAEHAHGLHRAGLHPIILWPYDVASTATVFLTRPDGSDGAQLDFLCDPLGVGKYGVRSTLVLDGAVPGERWPTIRSDHQLLYLLRKRWFKGSGEEVTKLRRSVNAVRTAALLAETEKMFSSRAAASMIRILENGTDRRPQWVVGAAPIQDGIRRLRRLRHPIGFWAEVVGDDARATAVALSTRFGRYLPWTRAERRGRAPAKALWWWRDVMSIRLRPGLFVSWGPTSSRILTANVTVRSHGRSLDDVAESVVTAMERRLLA